MNNQSQKKVLWTLILVALIVGAWAVGSRFQKNNTIVVPVEDTPTQQDGTVSTGTTYSNNTHGVTLQYTDEFVANTDAQNKELRWRNNSEIVGTRLLTIILPKETQPKTNFSSAEIAVGFSTDPIAVKECLLAKNGEQEKLGMIGGLSRPVFVLGDAGAGNYYETRSYRFLKDNGCLSFESLVHSVNVMNYPEEFGITEYDHDLINQKLQTVFDTVVLQ